MRFWTSTMLRTAAAAVLAVPAATGSLLGLDRLTGAAPPPTVAHVTEFPADAMARAAAALPAQAEFGPPANFVIDLDPPDPADAQFEPVAGAIYLLVDQQHDARSREPALYWRIAAQPLNVTGVENLSSYEVAYNPTFQRVVFHHIRVTRDGEVEDRRDRTRIDFARREAEFERRMFDGAVSALVRIDDVRVGDVVDVAYTVYGVNPAMAGEDFRYFQLAWAAPVERLSVRTIWPRRPAIRLLGQAEDFRDSRVSGGVLLEYGPAPVAALPDETGTPAWRYVRPGLNVSGFQDWTTVARWGRLLFEPQPDPAVDALAARIMDEHESAEARLLAALRFVQDDIRYFAVLLGEGGYVPQSTAFTLESRFGDCKAKTALLIALARAIGVEAHAAFVNLGAGRGLTDVAPSPGAFNHVIVRIRHDGRTYWLDPTASHQRGGLSSIAQADYGYALPLDGEADALVAMTSARPMAATTLVRERLDISAGPEAPVRLDVESIYSGRDADGMRARLASQGRAGLEQRYLDFYNQRFGDARFLDPLSVEDDTERNRLVVTESVELASPYGDPDPGFAYSFAFLAHAIPDVIASGAQRQRRHPLEIGYPVHSRHEVDIVLTEGGRGWTLPGQAEIISNPGFDFFYRTQHEGGLYSMSFELRSRAAEAGPEAAAEIITNHRRLQALRSYALNIQAPGTALADPVDDGAMTQIDKSTPSDDAGSQT